MPFFFSLRERAESYLDLKHLQLNNSSLMKDAKSYLSKYNNFREITL